MTISRSSAINSNIDANWTDANVGPPSVYLTIIGLLALTSSSLKYDNFDSFGCMAKRGRCLENVVLESNMNITMIKRTPAIVWDVYKQTHSGHNGTYVIVMICC